MSSGELLLTLLVALYVFGPKKLPMLAYHLGKLMGHINAYRRKVIDFWQQQVDEQQLQENIKKAEKADTKYQQKM